MSEAIPWGLWRKHSQEPCGSEVHDSDHCLWYTSPPQRGRAFIWDVCLGMSFSAAIASAICVLLHRENVIATHRFCQKRIKSSGKKWKSHIISNYLINYRSKPFMIIILMECHCYSTCVIYRERKPLLKLSVERTWPCLFLVGQRVTAWCTVFVFDIPTCLITSFRFRCSVEFYKYVLLLFYEGWFLNTLFNIPF